MACDFLLIGLTKGSQSFGANFNWFRMNKNDSHYALLTSSVYPIVNCAPPHVGDPTPTAIEHRSREASRDDSVARAQWRGDSRKRGAARKPAITIAGPLLAARPLCDRPRLPLTSRRGAFTNGLDIHSLKPAPSKNFRPSVSPEVTHEQPARRRNGA